MAPEPDTDGTPPEGVGPHEGRELELMLAGKKPMATFSDGAGFDDWFPEDDFAPYVADGTMVRREETYTPKAGGVPSRTVYFALKNEAWRIDALHAIKERLYVRGEPTNPETEREIGRLLGYSGEEVALYLRWVAESLARG